MDDSRDDELAERVAELESTLRELRTELRPGERRRGPFGLPSPPSPRELLTFTNEFAIPTAIAVLEANIRLLEMLHRVLQVGERSPSSAIGRSDESGPVGRVTRDTFTALDESLTELQTALEEGSLPREGAAREIIQDARRINSEIVDDLQASERTSEGELERSTDDIDEVADAGVEIDISSELQSIKDEVDTDEDEDESEGDEGS